ncbi:MAG: glycosyltransferase [Gammaproteobacteria bacterium]
MAKRYRILLTTIGSLGDLHPMIAVGLELRGRGHRVVFAVTELYREKIESLGFEFRPMRPHIPPEDKATVAAVLDPRRGPERLIRGILMPALRDSFDDLLAAACGADFMLAGEIVYAAPMLAEHANVPWAAYLTAPLSFLSAYDPSVLAPYPSLAKLHALGPTVNCWPLDLVRFVTRDWGAPVHALRRALNLSPAGNPIFEGKFSPHLNLAGFSPVLASPQRDWPANTVITGFTFYDGKGEGARLSPQLRALLNAGESPIVFTLGSAAVYAPGAFFEISARAAAILKRRAVLVMGDNPPPADLPHDIFPVNYAPYSDLFPLAAAIVHQGGIGTVAQGLRAGRPTLVMPYAFDQPDNALRLVRLGTSRTLSRKKYTARRAARELKRLLAEPLYETRAAGIARELQHENGAVTAVDAIERCLREPAIPGVYAHGESDFR